MIKYVQKHKLCTYVFSESEQTQLTVQLLEGCLCSGNQLSPGSIGCFRPASENNDMVLLNFRTQEVYEHEVGFNFLCH